MSTEFLIDGMLSGTGIRDALNGGYVDPRAIGLSEPLAGDLAAWLAGYEEAHFDGFPEDVVAELDAQGTLLASSAGVELPEARFGYYSNGLMARLV